MASEVFAHARDPLAVFAYSYHGHAAFIRRKRDRLFSNQTWFFSL